MTSHPPNPNSSPALRLLPLGAGVQSSTVLLLACDGVIPRFDYALFTDTGWEPRKVYENLARLRAHAETAGIPVRTVSAGNIRTDALDPAHLPSTPPTASSRCHSTCSTPTAPEAWPDANARASTRFRR